MTKTIIYPEYTVEEKRIVFGSCKNCPYYTIHTHMSFNPFEKIKKLSFCTAHTADIKDIKKSNKVNKKKTYIYGWYKDESRTYIFLENPDEIPVWCKLEDETIVTVKVL